jgi:site-specific DNA recombinase
MARADATRAASAIRCAIYTRKSSDEGLEQEFNSLDAQREACEAYIVSQRHAGWSGLPICMTMAACPAAPWSARP